MLVFAIGMEGAPKKKIYAVGAYRGAPTHLYIDIKSGMKATKFNLFINSPNHPVVLLVGAYEPAIWTLHITPGTVIDTVVIGGFYRQVITGLPKKTKMIDSKVLKISHGRFYVDKKRYRGVDQVSFHFFGRRVDQLVTAIDGKIYIGKKLPIYHYHSLRQHPDLFFSITEKVSKEKAVSSYRSFFEKFFSWVGW